MFVSVSAKRRLRQRPACPLGTQRRVRAELPISFQNHLLSLFHKAAVVKRGNNLIIIVKLLEDFYGQPRLQRQNF